MIHGVRACAFDAYEEYSTEELEVMAINLHVRLKQQKMLNCFCDIREGEMAVKPLAYNELYKMIEVLGNRSVREWYDVYKGSSLM